MFLPAKVLEVIEFIQNPLFCTTVGKFLLEKDGNVTTRCFFVQTFSSGLMAAEGRS